MRQRRRLAHTLDTIQRCWTTAHRNIGRQSALRWHRSHTASSIVLKKAYLRFNPSCCAICCFLEEPARFVWNTPSLLQKMIVPHKIEVRPKSRPSSLVPAVLLAILQAHCRPNPIDTKRPRPRRRFSHLLYITLPRNGVT